MRSTLNHFVSADTIVPDPASPQNYNRYSYVTNNPLRYVDPSGNCGGETSLVWDPDEISYVWQYSADFDTCNDLRQELEELYGVEIDYANWVLQEMLWLELALADMAGGFDGTDSFAAVFQGTTVRRLNEAGASEVFWPPNVVKLRDSAFSGGEDLARWVIIHEFGHRLDILTRLSASKGLEEVTGGQTTGFGCGITGGSVGGFFTHCNYEPGGISTVTFYGAKNRREDFAESFTATVYQGSWTAMENGTRHTAVADALVVAADRINYVQDLISELVSQN